MTDELDYTALAGMLGETIASAPTLDAWDHHIFVHDAAARDV